MRQRAGGFGGRTAEAGKTKPRPGGPGLRGTRGCGYSSGTSSRATMLMILISGLIAGPAVSL